MAKIHFKNGDTFEMHTDRINVTSISRVDPSWRYTDPAGHLHRWFEDRSSQGVADPVPAESYDPAAQYVVPTVGWVHDGTGYWEDGEPYEIGHYACNECQAEVKPGTCADEDERFIAGLKHCFINDQRVPHDEFMRRYEAAKAADAKEKENG